MDSYMKKYIYNIIGIAALGLMASCSSDSDYQAVAESSINILSAQTSLGPNVSEGAVTVDCTPVEAYTDEPSWLTTAIEGNTVKLTSTANDNRQSRNAKLVIKKAANDSVVVNVSQYGLVLTMDKEAIIINDDKAGSFTKACSSNTDIHLLETPSWVKASIDADSKQVTVDVEENTTGHLRACYVKYQAAAVVDSFMVKQFDYDTDIAGKYAFGYYDFNEDHSNLELHAVECTIDREYLSVPEWGFKFPITVDETNCSIGMRSNQLVGTFGKYFVYPMYVDMNGSAYYQNDTGLIECPFVWDAELGTSGFFSGYAWNLNGEKSAAFLGMILQIYKANVPSPSNMIGTWGWIIQPYLWKVEEMDSSTEAQARKLAPQLSASTINRVKSFTL